MLFSANNTLLNSDSGITTVKQQPMTIQVVRFWLSERAGAVAIMPPTITPRAQRRSSVRRTKALINDACLLALAWAIGVMMPNVMPKSAAPMNPTMPMQAKKTARS